MKRRLKYLVLITAFIVSVINTSAQKLDSNAIRKILTGTWVDVKDSNHSFIFSRDSVAEIFANDMPFVIVDKYFLIDLKKWGYTHIKREKNVGYCLYQVSPFGTCNEIYSIDTSTLVIMGHGGIDVPPPTVTFRKKSNRVHFIKWWNK